MHAMVIDEWGGPETLHEAEVEPPPGGPGRSCSIRIRAAGRQPRRHEDPRGQAGGHVPVPLPADPRAGTPPASVEQVGPAVTWFQPGDEVYGYCRRHHLQYGTYARVHHRARRASSPTSRRELSFEEAAALPLAGLTAHQALETLGVRGGETLFVTGGAGGVGHLADPARGRARRARDRDRLAERNHDFLRELGAEPLDYDDERRPRARARARPATAAPTPRSTCSAATAASRRSPSCAAAAGSSRSPAAAGAARRLRDPLHLRAPERLRPAASSPSWSHEGRLQPARRGGLPARARRRGARAPRGRPRARQARAQRRWPERARASRSTPSSAERRRPSVSTKKPTRGRASRLVVGAPDQPGLVERGQVDGRARSTSATATARAARSPPAASRRARRRRPSAASRARSRPARSRDGRRPCVCPPCGHRGDRRGSRTEVRNSATISSTAPSTSATSSDASVRSGLGDAAWDR